MDKIKGQLAGVAALLAVYVREITLPVLVVQILQRVTMTQMRL